MTADRLKFDEKSHTYSIDGCELPSVTTVLGDLIPCWKASEWYLQRGTAVHACAALIAEGKVFTNVPVIDGQVAACRKFFNEVHPAVMDVEKRVLSVVHGYAGTLDLIATIQGTPLLIDYKASVSSALPYQLCAYSLAIQEMTGLLIRHGCGVTLREDGTYKMTEKYDLRRYKAGWLALLGAYHVRRECGVKLEGVGE